MFVEGNFDAGCSGQSSVFVHFTREKTHDETSAMGARAMGRAPMTEVSSRVFFTSNERKRTTCWNNQKKGLFN
jgi:hypothetical protein